MKLVRVLCWLTLVGGVVVSAAPSNAWGRTQDGATSVPVTADLPEAVARVLARRVSDLPRAEPGAWRGWLEQGAPTGPTGEAYGAALDAYGREDLSGCLVHLQAMLEGTPDHPAGLHLLGVVHFRLRRHADCVEAFERFLVHAPESVGRTRHLGHALYELGRLGEAEVHYDRVLEAAPADLEARRGRALTRLRRGDPDAALTDLDELLGVRPDHGEARYWRARVRFERDGDGDLEAARADLERAAELRPFDPRVPYLAAQVLDELGRAADAELARERYQRLEALEGRARGLEARLLLESERLDLLRDLASLRLAAGDRTRAFEVLQRLLRGAEAAPDAALADWARAQLGALRLGR